MCSMPRPHGLIGPKFSLGGFLVGFWMHSVRNYFREKHFSSCHLINLLYLNLAYIRYIIKYNYCFEMGYWRRNEGGQLSEGVTNTAERKLNPPAVSVEFRRRVLDGCWPVVRPRMCLRLKWYLEGGSQLGMCHKGGSLLGICQRTAGTEWVRPDHSGICLSKSN